MHKSLGHPSSSEMCYMQRLVVKLDTVHLAMGVSYCMVFFFLFYYIKYACPPLQSLFHSGPLLYAHFSSFNLVGRTGVNPQVAISN